MKLCFSILLIFLTISCTQKNNQQSFSLNSKYLDRNLPGDSAQLFSPGIISTGFHDDAAPQFSSDFNKVYYRIAQVPHSIIIERERIKNKWSEAKIVSFSGQYNDGVPGLKPDGSRIYFESYRPINDSMKVNNNEDLWYVEKSGNDWSFPIHLDKNVNSDKGEFGASIAYNGNLYFTSSDETGLKIFISEYDDGKHQNRQVLDDNINIPNAATPCIAADESFIIFSSINRQDSYGGLDLYISFNINNNWSKAINLSNKINSKYNDYFPSLSPDGKYMFFVSNRGFGWEHSDRIKSYEEMIKIYNSPGNGKNDIYWVRTDFIENLNPNK